MSKKLIFSILLGLFMAAAPAIADMEAAKKRVKQFLMNNS